MVSAIVPIFLLELSMPDFLKSNYSRPGLARCALSLGWVFALHSLPALAELQDEIQVYTDDINHPREFRLELHVNNTLEGRSQPGYAGEVVPQHATRINPEFSYGVSDTVEAGLYVPTNLQANGAYSVAGAKLRLKWLPVQPQKNGGWFAGENIELSALAHKYSESRGVLELRTITGYHGQDWQVAFNPIFDINLSPDTDRRNPDFNIGFKVARKVLEGVWVGPEYYSDFGKVRHFESWTQQNNVAYLVADVDRGPLPFQLGIGRAVSAAADRWTIKAIFEVPL